MMAYSSVLSPVPTYNPFLAVEQSSPYLRLVPLPLYDIPQGVVQHTTTKSNQTTLSLAILQQVDLLRQQKPELFRMSKIPVERWLEQFNTPDDQATALLLLKGLQIFDVERLRSSLKAIHQQVLQETKGTLDHTRFSYLGAAKSGALISYFYRQANHLKGDSDIPETHFLEFGDIGKTHCDNAKKPIKQLVILDDVILSGRQSIDYLRPLKDKLSQYDKVLLYCVTATTTGLEKVKEAFPDINLTAKSVHTVKHAFEGQAPHSGLYTIKEQASIKDLVRRYSHHFVANPLLKPKERQGLLAFFYNSPDETMPLLTYQSPHPLGWHALFPRYWGTALDIQG
jgi:hypothetical protein